MPWFACISVEENHRNRVSAERLLSYGLVESQKRELNTLYLHTLSTELIDFFEKKG